MESHLDKLIETARANSTPLTLMIVDIDHFKRVNDTYGHDAGDEVLKAFSQRLRGIIRLGDLLCRLGGEEFVLVMPGPDARDAVNIAERVLQVIEQEKFPLGPSGRLLTITASIGLAERGEALDWRDLYHRADQALYRAKAAGRNRVSAAA